MGKKALIIAMLIVFVFGLFLALLPIINGKIMDNEISDTANKFISSLETSPAATLSAEKEESISEEKPYQNLWDAMQQYNQTLYEQKQASLQGPDDYEHPSFRLQNYGLEDEIFAVIAIPKINLEMPVYLGATDTNLAYGAAHLSQTSLPIGGENTNCVIAGHRGWNGAAYFRYIPDLVKGDIVTIRNLWETLTYVVVETKIIAPNDVDAIHIQEGRDLLTLLTCHPYASGGKQRFLVICERVN